MKEEDDLYSLSDDEGQQLKKGPAEGEELEEKTEEEQTVIKQAKGEEVVKDQLKQKAAEKGVQVSYLYC